MMLNEVGHEAAEVQPQVQARGGQACAGATQLVSDAMLIAIWRRRPSTELLHHSDRGSQYSSDQFQQLLGQRGDGELLLDPEDRADQPQG
jgi:hypothetical protein